MTEVTAAQIAKRLYNWQYQRTDCFTDLLFDAIAKSTAVDRMRLKLGFPLETDLYMQWLRSPTPEKFFTWYGVAPTAQEIKEEMVEG